MRIKRIAAAAAALPLLLGVAACGNADDGGDPTASEATTSDSTAAEADSPSASPSEQAEAGSEVDVQEFLDRMKTATEDKQSMHMTMDMDAGGQQISMKGKAHIAGDKSKMDMTMNVPGAGEMHMILADGMIYLNIPGATPDGKFVKVDPSDPKNPMSQQFGDLAESMDPTRTFDAFDAGLQKVRYDGTDKVDGEELDKYTLTVDTKAAMKAQGQQQQAGLPETLEYQVWLDSQDLMRKVSFQLQGAEAVITTDKWGEPVDVKAPAKADVMEMPAGGSGQPNG